MNVNSEKHDELERQFKLQERRLALEHSFPRRWLPTIATLLAGLIATWLGYVEQDRARIDAKAREYREWEVQIANLYFDKPDLFDFTKDPSRAEANFHLLHSMAPAAIQPDIDGMFKAERTRMLLAPAGTDDVRIGRFAAVAAVQADLQGATSGRAVSGSQASPSDFTVYVQYRAASDVARGSALRARSALLRLGYHVPGLQQIDAVPNQLQVRYYYPDQQQLACALHDEVTKALSSAPSDAGTRCDEEMSQGQVLLFQAGRALPRDILELWIP